MDEHPYDDGASIDILPTTDNRSLAEKESELKLRSAIDYDFKQEIQLQGINLANSLEDAIFSSQEDEKPLILYVYNIEDIFFKRVRDIFKNKNVNDLFKDFTIFVWDVSDEATNKNLMQFAKVQSNLKCVQSKVEERSTTLFVFMTVESLKLQAAFGGSFKDEEFVNHLYNLQRLNEEMLLEKYAKIEMECLESAVINFEKEFGTDHLPFSKNRVEDSLESVLNAEPPYLRKNIILWFYNKNNIWCKQFGRLLLNNDPIRNILKKFYIIAWDIGNSSNKETLRTIITKIFELKYDDMYGSLDCKENSIFVFAKDESNQVILKHSVYGEVKRDDLIVRLIEIQSELENKYEITNPAELQAIDLFLRNNGLVQNSLFCNARPLSEVIPEKCLCRPVQERKMLLMLFSNNTEKLPKNFLGAVEKKKLEIQGNFIVIPWEISDSVPYKNLNLAIRRHFDLEKMEKLLSSRRSGIYVFMPIANSLSLFSFIEEGTSSSKISKTIEVCVTFFTTEKEIEMKLSGADANGDGAAHFQQAIFDQLGNRDYDSFNLDKDQGQYLKDKIHFAFYGPPDKSTLSGKGEKDKGKDLSDEEKVLLEKEKNEQIKEKIASIYEKILQKVKNKSTLSGKEEEDKEKDLLEKEQIKREKKIASIYEKILEQVKKFSANPKEIVISFIYNCLVPLPKERLNKLDKDPEYKPNLDFTPVPVFIIRKCVRSPSRNPCRIFIDHDERVYTSWNNYLENNKLPHCLFLVPKDGKYQGDVWDNVRVECRLSPMCGIGSTILSTADIGTAAVGIVAGVIGLVSLATPIAPIISTGAIVAGITSGVYSMGRSSMTIHDRICHDQSMSIFNGQARGAYINIVAGSLSFTGSGAACALTYFASNGVKIGMITKGAVDGLTGINILVSGAAVANSTYEVMYQWYDTNEAPDTLTLVQLSSSILFFGHAVYSTRSADSIVNEAQMLSLKEIKASLKSNRHRKTFNKLTKETIRITGDAQKGNAEVISYIKNLNNQDEVLAMLTRSNKHLNKKGIRYMVNDGELNFNGIKVSVSEFTNLSKIQRNEYMLNLPPIMESTPTQKQKLLNTIETQLSEINVIRFGNIVANIIKDPTMTNLCSNLLNLFSGFIRKKFIFLIAKTLEALNLDVKLQISISQLYPKAEIFVRVLELIKSFLSEIVIEKEKEYFANGGKENDDETFFNRKKINRIIFFLEGTIIALTITLEEAIEEILKYAHIWIANQLVKTCETNEPAASEIPQNTAETKCTECGGFYYVGSK